MTGGDRTSEVFAALAESRRRTILRHCIRGDRATASYDELLGAVIEADGPPRDRETAELQLHHADLPRLEQCGLVEYDDRSETVRYLGNSLVERVLDERVADRP